MSTEETEIEILVPRTDTDRVVRDLVQSSAMELRNGARWGDLQEEITETLASQAIRIVGVLVDEQAENAALAADFVHARLGLELFLEAIEEVSIFRRESAQRLSQDPVALQVAASAVSETMQELAKLRRERFQ